MILEPGASADLNIIAGYFDSSQWITSAKMSGEMLDYTARAMVL